MTSIGRSCAVLGIFVCCFGCGGGRATRVDVAFRVRAPLVGTDGTLDDRPLVGADRALAWVEGPSGTRIEGTLRSAALPASNLSLPALPFGRDLTLRVEAYAGSVLLARGRSFPFDVSARGATRAPDLFVGSLGRFGRRLASALPANGVAGVAGVAGAVVATADGRVLQFSPLDEPPFTDTGTQWPLTTAWFEVGRRYLGAFDASANTLTLIRPDGGVAVTLSDALLTRHGANAMIVADAAGASMVIIGGFDGGPGESATALTRVDVPSDPAAATITSLAPIPGSRWGGSASWVAGASQEDDRIVVLGGASHGAATDAIFIDPHAAGTSVFVAAPALNWPLSTIIPLAAGQLLAVGGSAGADVHLLIATSGTAPTLVEAAPAPPSLSVHRDAPRLVRYGDSLVLVIGGTSSSALVRSAELIDLRIFPGTTVQTGSLPASVIAPLAMVLDDQSVWVLDRGGSFGYVPPRGP